MSQPLHLSDEQLGARLDGALPPRDAGAVEAHLAGCESCRARLAALAELNVALGRALEHDPGEAYFASFADRVTERIRAQGAAAAAPGRAAPAARRGAFAWASSPRALAWAGGTLGVLAVAALALVLARGHGVEEFASRVAPGARVRDEIAAPPSGAAPVPAPGAGAGAGAPAPAADQGAARRTLAPRSAPQAGEAKRASAAAPPREPVAYASPPQAGSATLEQRAPGDARTLQAQGALRQGAATGRVQQVKPMANGENEVVPGADRPAFARAPAAEALPSPAPATAGRSLAKPMAQPLQADRLAARDEGASSVARAAGAPEAASQTPGFPGASESKQAAKALGGNVPLAPLLAAGAVAAADSAARAAEDSSRAAVVAGTAASWSHAAQAWLAALARSAPGRHAADARWQLAQARVRTWQLTRTAGDRAAALAAVSASDADSLAAAPRRALAAWRAELATQ